MENIAIPAAKNKPEVLYLPESKTLELKGRSIPENAEEFYQQIKDWIAANREAISSGGISLNVHLEYFNTSSYKCLLDLFKNFDAINTAGNIVINWYYDADDEDMLEAGEDLLSYVKLQRNLIEVEE